MDGLAMLLRELAVLALVGAGIAAVVQLARPRDVLLRSALGFFLLSVFIPYADKNIAAATSFASCDGRGTQAPNVGAPQLAGGTALVILGHIGLGAWLIRRRMTGRDAVRERMNEVTRSRSRERPRLPADVGDDEP